MSDAVAAALAEYGDRTRVALCDYLAPREPRRHLWDVAADYPWRGGRMLRSSLCLAVAQGFGASASDALETAVGIELLHNAFLVHDDVEDESDARRGQPTLHALHGVPIAVNVGDGLLTLGLRALMDNRVKLGASLTVALLEDACRMARETVEGQAIELGWRRDNALALPDEAYLQMVLKKTCWYSTIFPLRMGALIGTHDPDGLDRFLPFGFFLGAAFQIRDDLLNLEGDERRYGKEIGGDLWEGKRTLMLAHLLRVLPEPERLRVADFLAQPRAERSEGTVQWIRDLMESCGSVEHARAVAHALAGAARHEFEVAFRDLPDSRHRAFLAAMPDWVLSRA